MREAPAIQNGDGASARDEVRLAPHAKQTVAWQTKSRPSNREDRLLTEIAVSLPPKISDLTVQIPPTVSAESERALGAIAQLDTEHGEHLAALATLLLRAESVASSKIEHIEASMEDFARASHGMKSNSSATSMVASAKALRQLIGSVENNAAITVENILKAHSMLMADDPTESNYAGRVRDMQNWIGDSDYSPRGAAYIPPPSEIVEGYLSDLLEFANRDDVPVLAQAAIAHAQFESIHPFTDGNGRIGRALINTILRRRGVTSRVVVPLASALVAQRETYFDVLAAYRAGDSGPIIRAFAHAAQTAARESRISAIRLAEMPTQWNERHVAHTGRKPRSRSAASNILERLPDTPFFTAEEMEIAIGGKPSSVYRAIEMLSDSEILRPLTDRKRNQVWCASAVIEELEDLGMRIAAETKQDAFWRHINVRERASAYPSGAVGTPPSRSPREFPSLKLDGT